MQHFYVILTVDRRIQVGPLVTRMYHASIASAVSFLDAF